MANMAPKKILAATVPTPRAILQARDSLRRLIEFRRVNLSRPLPVLPAFDGIVCRNVLIYFDEETRRLVCERLSAALRPGGWLLLGESEVSIAPTLGFEVERFEQATFFRKTGDQVARPAEYAFPASTPVLPKKT